MNNLGLIEKKATQEQSPNSDPIADSGAVPSLSWKGSPSIQHLLDVISSIIAEEYITIAKQNPEVFSKIASGASRPRNDTPTGGVRNDRLGNEIRNDTF